MNFRFVRNLGRSDVDFLNSNFAAGLNHKDCTEGCVLNLGDRESAWLLENRKGLIEPVENVKAIAKKPEVTAPAK